jgi:hypothetical protein
MGKEDKRQENTPYMYLLYVLLMCMPHNQDARTAMGNEDKPDACAAHKALAASRKQLEHLGCFLAQVCLNPKP